MTWIHSRPGCLSSTLMLCSLCFLFFIFLLAQIQLAPTPPCLSVCLSITTDRQSLPISAHCPPSGSIPSVSAILTPPSPLFLLSGWPCFTPPQTTAQRHTILGLPPLTSLFLPVPALSLSLLSSPPALPPHRCLARFATAVSPCATTKCCLQSQGRAGVGVGGVSSGDGGG